MDLHQAKEGTTEHTVSSSGLSDGGCLRIGRRCLPSDTRREKAPTVQRARGRTVAAAGRERVARRRRFAPGRPTSEPPPVGDCHVNYFIVVS